MPAISFGGLSSELDTTSIVESLVEVRTQQMIDPLEERISEIESRQVSLAAFQALLGNLKTTAETLDSATSISGRAAASSDSTIVSLSEIDNSASEGTYSMYVNQVATNDRIYYQGVADTDSTTFGGGTITIESNGVSKTVTIGITDTLEDIVDAINATEDIEVQASIVNDGTGVTPYRLILTSTATGDDADITTDLATVLVGFTVDAALTTANDSVNASVTINSLTITNSTNTFTEALPGVTFTVEEVSTDVVTVTVESNQTEVTSAIEDFVDAYNALASAYSSQFSYNEATESLGVLGSDLMLQQSQMRTKGFVFDIYGDLGLSNIKSLVHMGITVDSDGQLSIDSDVLATALEDHPQEVLTLFQGTDSNSGLMSGLYDYLDSLVNSTDGTLTQKYDGYGDTIDNLNDMIDDRTSRIEAYEARLNARFLYMEQVLAQLQAMGDTLESLSEQMANMNSNN